MELNFDELKKGAEENMARDQEETREAWEEFDRQKKEEADRLNEALAALVPHLDIEHEANMNREIEEAKIKAEAEVREKYSRLHGSKEWNRNKTDDAMLNMIRSMQS